MAREEAKGRKNSRGRYRFKPQVSRQGTLSLYLCPPLRRCRWSWIHRLPSVTAQDLHHFHVQINGQHSTIFVDTGASHPLMSYSMAKRLGLVDKFHDFIDTHLMLWRWQGKARCGILKNIPVTFANDMTVYCSFLVFTDIAVRSYMAIHGYEDCCLDTETMRDYHIIQKFHDNVTTLFFKNLDVVNNSLRGRNLLPRPRACYLRAHLTPTCSDPPLRLLMDSGADNSYMNQKLLQTISAQASTPRSIRRVRMQLDDHHSIMVPITSSFKFSKDFIFGVNIMRQFSTTLDYKENDVYFQINGKVYTTKLDTREPLRQKKRKRNEIEIDNEYCQGQKCVKRRYEE